MTNRPGYTCILLRLPEDWMPDIDDVRGEMERSQFIRDCIRRRIGRQKKDLPPGRGRPKVALDDVRSARHTAK